MNDQNRRELINKLTKKGQELRYGALSLNNRTLHAGGALSCADIISVLFYHILKFDPKNPDWEARDYFINSRGHACEPIYCAMAELGFFPAEDLKQVEEYGCHLHGLSAVTTRGVEFSCGSLGMALSFATGTAAGLKAQNKANRVYIVTGDGEWQEGNIWEAAMFAGNYGLDNLTVIVDRNKFQSNNRGTETVMALEPFGDKLKAFGFAVARIDGHDIAALMDTIGAVPLQPGKPSLIIADTIKGKGVSFFEKSHNHCGRFGRDFSLELFEQALNELKV